MPSQQLNPELLRPLASRAAWAVCPLLVWNLAAVGFGTGGVARMLAGVGLAVVAWLVSRRFVTRRAERWALFASIAAVVAVLIGLIEVGLWFSVGSVGFGWPVSGVVAVLSDAALVVASGLLAAVMMEAGYVFGRRVATVCWQIVVFLAMGLLAAQALRTAFVPFPLLASVSLAVGMATRAALLLGWFAAGLFTLLVAFPYEAPTAGVVSRCPNCRYDLTGTRASSCPECGVRLFTKGLQRSRSSKPAELIEPDGR